MNRDIPLHLFCGTEKRFLHCKRHGLIQGVRAQGVSSLWVEATGKDERRFFEEIRSRYSMDIVSVVKDASVIQSALEQGVTGIAVHPSLVEDLLRFKDYLRKRSTRIYVSHNGEDRGFVQSKSRALDVFHDISCSVEALRESGIGNISVQFSHPDTVINFRINKLLKERFRTHHVISFVSLPSRAESALVNSLVLGSLFYERIGNSVLIQPLPRGINRRRHLNFAIEFSKKILGALELSPVDYRIISCPTCGRCQTNLKKVAARVDRSLKKMVRRYRREGKNLEDVGGIVVAVMGCSVNGPGEAKNADIGIAGEKNRKGTIFKRGEPVATLPENKLVDRLMVHAEEIIEQKFLAER